MINTKYVVIVDDTDEVWNFAVKKFQKESEYQFIQTDSSTKSVKEAMQNIPDLVIINGDELKNNELTLMENIRKNTSITPIILVSSKAEKEHRVALLKRGMDFYIKKPLNEDYFYYTIRNISKLISSNRCISGLTGLPGNVQIANELQRRIMSKKTYAILYVDLDVFTYSPRIADKFHEQCVEKHVSLLENINIKTTKEYITWKRKLWVHSWQH